ncbi:MAG: hypothetical protein ACFNLQ_07975 [Capnocytophaga ochracea]
MAEGRGRYSIKEYTHFFICRQRFKC